MTSLSFKKANRVGQEFEKELVPLLEKRGIKAYKMKGNFYPYDFELISGNARGTLEAKWDKMAGETGNVCLELRSLNFSNADFLAYKLPTGVYLFHTKDVRDYANRCPNRRSGGEFGDTLALVPIDTFLKEVNHTLLDSQTVS